MAASTAAPHERTTRMAEISIRIVCDNCGRNLEETGESYNRNDISITVKPCSDCAQAEYDRGYDEGEKEASNE